MQMNQVGLQSIFLTGNFVLQNLGCFHFFQHSWNIRLGDKIVEIFNVSNTT